MRQIAKGSSLLRRVLTSIFLGFTVAAAGAFLEYLLQGSSPFSLASLDDVVVGVITGLVVFAYEQRRHQEVLRKISVIAAMNHHVRNALQSISYAPYAEQTRQIKVIEEAVQRIQWALREILPGEVDESRLFEHTSGESGKTP
jgi:hypothetical protein